MQRDISESQKMEKENCKNYIMTLRQAMPRLRQIALNNQLNLSRVKHFLLACKLMKDGK